MEWGQMAWYAEGFVIVWIMIIAALVFCMIIAAYFSKKIIDFLYKWDQNTYWTGWRFLIFPFFTLVMSLILLTILWGIDDSRTIPNSLRLTFLSLIIGIIIRLIKGSENIKYRVVIGIIIFLSIVTPVVWSQYPVQIIMFTGFRPLVSFVESNEDQEILIRKFSEKDWNYNICEDYPKGRTCEGHWQASMGRVSEIENFMLEQIDRSSIHCEMLINEVRDNWYVWQMNSKGVDLYLLRRAKEACANVLKVQEAITSKNINMCKEIKEPYRKKCIDTIR